MKSGFWFPYRLPNTREIFLEKVSVFIKDELEKDICSCPFLSLHSSGRGPDSDCLGAQKSSTSPCSGMGINIKLTGICFPSRGWAFLRMWNRDHWIKLIHLSSHHITNTMGMQHWCHPILVKELTSVACKINGS